jgi:sialidase-1
MKSIFPFLTLLMLVPPSVVSAAEPDFADREIVQAGQHGYHTYRIPAVVRVRVTEATQRLSAELRQETLLLFLEGRKYSSSDFGEVHLLVLRSTDLGNTWTDPHVVHKEDTLDKDITMGNPCPAYDHCTGRVWLVFTRDNQQVFVTSSDDGGQSWQKPRNITEAVRPSSWTRYWTGPGHGLHLEHGAHRGRLLFPSYHLEADDSQLYMRSHAIYSDDHGKSWQIGMSTRLGDAIDEVVFKAGWVPQGGFVWAGCECLAAELSNGQLYLTVRNQVALTGRIPQRKAFATSDDGGTTWTPLALHDEVPGLKCQSGLARLQGGSDAEGDWLLLSGITGSDSRGGNRRDLAVFLSRDGGRSWPKSKLLHEGPAAYSDMCVLADGTVLCLYEGGVKHRYESIRQARFNRAWLTRGFNGKDYKEE